MEKTVCDGFTTTYWVLFNMKISLTLTSPPLRGQVLASGLPRFGSVVHPQLQNLEGMIRRVVSHHSKEEELGQLKAQTQFLLMFS